MNIERRKEHRYQVRVLDSSANVVAVYDDLAGVYYRKQVNSAGLATLTVPDGHDILNHTSDDTIFEIVLSYTPFTANPFTGWLKWERDFLGVYRDRQIATDGFGNAYHLLYIPSTIEVLSRYVTGYPAGINARSEWTTEPIATIADELAIYNATAAGTTADGRIRNVQVVGGLTSDGAIGGTASINYSAGPGRNLLEVLQELAQAGGYDFDVIIESTSTNLEINHHSPTDRSADVIFDLSLDNLLVSNLDFDGLREKTVAIVGGEGEGTSRIFAVRTGPNFAATNDYEVFVDARDKDDTELDDLGDIRLGELQARLQMQNTFMLTEGWTYKRDFGHGDLVTAQFAGFSETKKIGVTEVKFDQSQNFRITFELVEP